MRIGILGGGQLGRMVALAARPLGHSVVVLESAEEIPSAVASDVIVAPYDDEIALDELARRSDVVTCEFESVPPAALARIAAAGVPVRPTPEAFRIASDRWLEKSMFRELGLATAPFEAVDDQASLEAAVSRIGLPAVLKTRRNGYDGKGQRVLRADSDVPGAFAALGSVPMILEGFVAFERELSIVAARGLDGSVVFYDVVENVHVDGILHRTNAPAPRLRAPIVEDADRAARLILERLDYVGVIAVELFEDGSGIRINEIAPRVHNSGHWTIEGAATSQFENHVRAITGAPLGTTKLRAPSTMINLVGLIPDPAAVLAVADAHLHLYDKRPKPGRKVGHVTIVDGDPDPIERLAKRA